MHIIVTGATKGIGKAIVYLFASQGYHISFCARNQEDIKEMTASLQSLYPEQQFYGTAVDISDTKALQSWVQSLINADLAIDILVNNAGVYLPGNVSDEAEGTLESQLQTNLLSAYHLTRALLPTMLQQQAGHIFNMCSIASLQAYPGGGSYSISKFALLGFSENLRLELQDKGIKVTAVLPGATYSNSWAGADIAPERIMEANDIAASIWNAANLSAQAVVEKIILRPQLGDL